MFDLGIMGKIIFDDSRMRIKETSYGKVFEKIGYFAWQFMPVNSRIG